MDKSLIIELIKTCIKFFSITPEELGIEAKQKYRPIKSGAELSVKLESKIPFNKHYLGILNRDQLVSTEMKSILEPVSKIMIVDSDTIEKIKKYYICVEN